MRSKRARKALRVKRQQSKCEGLGRQCTETNIFVTRWLWSVYKLMHEGRETVLGMRRPTYTKLFIDAVHGTSFCYSV
jgi:hypothetical protein